ARGGQRIRAIRLRPRAWLGQVDRLVMLAVLSAVRLVWLVLVGFDAFTTFVGQLDEIGRGNYRLATAASFVLMTLPRRAWEMYGYAALLGSLVGLGQLAGSGELTASRRPASRSARSGNRRRSAEHTSELQSRVNPV